MEHILYCNKLKNLADIFKQAKQNQNSKSKYNVSRITTKSKAIDANTCGGP